MRILPSFPGLVGVCGLLAGCGDPLPLPSLTSDPEVTRQVETAPPGADPNSCWGKHVVPAIYETVTEQIMLQPAEVLADGSVIQPAIYKTEVHQAVVRERKETWFETPCSNDLTVEFVETLQRALKVRGFYYGAPSGEIDGRTRTAIRKYQKPQGLDSGILSLAAARKLGLIAVENPDA
ncbi:His-Xaa-Ser repeat protein HxsA [Thalassovita gelatinovora]|uniref:His-Xaa-Ser repeat protein HxsA n=2 Tax=Thalassovita gelatinovora TaxID=53501 RepID=A0A0P1FC03_THAGE|nr:peptidoglycan-binding protein [Thalassovita gelatinovora]QIZ82475.1 peptidoglycan-binding protein [Thalassovita gelatinovora]CUH65656.1 His-Xaa-Ser repeat protein HxsA [Thalassovita gelatinovora]SER05513.1 Putative peptidoglycan binding domain-containing protein [Thalassovita gelatinovora]